MGLIDKHKDKYKKGDKEERYCDCNYSSQKMEFVEYRFQPKVMIEVWKCLACENEKYNFYVE